jgi:outer membrane protein assembly factor BamA
VRWTLLLALIAVACRPVPPKVTVDHPIVIDEVRLEGFEVLPVDVRDELRDELPLGAGRPLRDEDEKAAGERAVETLQNHGYPYGQVGLARESTGAGRVRLVLRAEPGTRGFFGRIDIAGNRSVDDRIIRRRLAYAPGDPFTRAAIQRSQQNVGALGLFKSIEIRAHDIDNRPADVPTLITVEERTPWHWNLGLGYAAGDKLGVEARVSHRNFFGSARRLDLEGRVSAIERNAGVTFTQTDAWHPALGLSLEARHQEIDERSFVVLSRGGQASASWQWSPRVATTAAYAVALERSDVASSLDLLTGLQDGMLSAWSVDLDWRRNESTRDRSALSAGPLVESVTLHVEQAGGWMPGTFNYFNVVGDVRRYHHALDNRVIVAGRFRYGSIEPFDAEADIPLLKRFFLGGSSEMRGWGLYELSPLSAAGEPLGGKTSTSATGELRVRLFPRVWAVLFVEAGNVWQETWRLKLNDLLYDAGPGLRVDTPFGRLRVDVGYQLKTLDGLRLDGRPQSSRWRINFGIGEAF